MIRKTSLWERLGFDITSGYSEGRKVLILSSLFVLLLITMGVAITFGAYSISIVDVYGIVLAHLSPFGDLSSVTKLHNTIVWELRIPRVLLAVAVGTALATAGAVFQGCFRNPLVEPYILGISSGAAFGGNGHSLFQLHRPSALCIYLWAMAVAMALHGQVIKETPI